MKKIRRILSFVVAMAMIMSMSTLCFLVTAEGESTSVQLGKKWSLGIAVGDVGSEATLADGPFSLASKAGALSGTVTEVSGVASIVTTEETPRRAFSKSPSGIIDITPAMSTVSQIIFTAPVAGEYYYDLSVVITSTTQRAGLWTEIGKYNNGFNNTDPAWGYSSAAITNGTFDGWLYNTDRLEAAKTVTLAAGETLILSVEADTGDNGKTNTDETQLTVNKFNVTYMGDATTTTSESLDLTIGTDASAAKKVSDTTGFSLGAMYKVGDEYVEVPLEDEARASWDAAYPGWYTAEQEGIASKYVFLRSYQGGILNMRPTSDNGDYLAVIKYTATEAGDYFVVGSFTKVECDGRIHGRDAEADDVDSDITDYLSVQKNGVVYASATMSEEAPTANLSATVYLDAGESLYIVERNDYLWTGGAETVVNSLKVLKSAHVCAYWNDDATCKTGATCVDCGEATGETNANNHETPNEYTYTNTGETHYKFYACCDVAVEENVPHDFSNGDCECGATAPVVASTDYIVKLVASAASVSKNSTVDVTVKLSGDRGAYAAGEAVVTYDPNVFEYVGTNLTVGDTVRVNDDGNGKVVIVVTGAETTFGTDTCNVVILTFKAVAETAGANITVDSAAFSTKADAESEDLTVATLETAAVSVAVTPEVFEVEIEDESKLTGNSTVVDGNSYEVTYNNYSQYYDYDGVIEVMVGDVDVTEHVTFANGTWTVPADYIDGKITISVVGAPTAKKFNTTFIGSEYISSNDGAEATYGTPYTFTIIADEGDENSTDEYTIYVLDYIMIGETKYVVKNAEGETNPLVSEIATTTDSKTYEIKGNAIIDDITIAVVTGTQTPGMATVTVGSTAGLTVNAEETAQIGQEFEFTVDFTNADPLYTYTVKYNGNVIEAVEGVYTIANVDGPVNITVEKTLTATATVKSDKEYLDLGTTKMWLVLVEGEKFTDDRVYTINGEEMFWSEKYDAYCYLVIAAEAPAANGLQVDIATTGTNDVDYGMNVNKSENGVDANDAQFVWNMYNAKDYTSFDDASMEKFLRADVTGDKAVDISDAAKIIGECVAKYDTANN